jgi:hypothetical protein
MDRIWDLLGLTSVLVEVGEIEVAQKGAEAISTGGRTAIVSTGEIADAFVQHVLSKDTERAIAAFETMDDAQIWLQERA